MITLLAIVISGCTSSSPTTSPAANTPPATTTAPATGGNVPSGVPVAAVNGQTTTISGSQGGDVNVAMTKGGYIFKVQSKDSNFELDRSGFQYLPQEASLETSGWYELSDVKGWSSDGQAAFTVKTNAPYTITITNLPAGTPVTSPQTFTGKGLKALGPITLKAGSATFKLQGPSMAHSGFSVQLKDGTTGNVVSLIDTNAAMDSSQSSYQSQKTINVAAAGDYYIVVYTNGLDSWKVDVSQ